MLVVSCYEPPFTLATQETPRDSSRGCLIPSCLPSVPPCPDLWEPYSPDNAVSFKAPYVTQGRVALAPGTLRDAREGPPRETMKQFLVSILVWWYERKIL
jgi:hypothetical protein